MLKPADKMVGAIRDFNRFYTRKIGLVDGTASSPFSLAEARVLFELARLEKPTATEIRKELGLDAGYMSRILGEFERQKLITRERSAGDERQKALSLTAKGRSAFAPLDERSSRQMSEMVENLSTRERKQLVDAAQTIQRLLGDKRKAEPPYLLREHQPGDLGWVVHRQALLYAEEYGWDGTYEALAAEIVAQFVKHYDAKREHCWIAERDGARVGAVLIAKASDEIAKLRLLHVESEARGLGIGGRLVAECLTFARRAGYREIVLWTNDVLHAARRIYQRAGFELIASQPHHSFGHDLVGQDWRLALK